KGSNLNAANNLNIKAKKIDILAVNDSSYIEKKSSSSGFMSSSTTLDIELKENVKSSKLNANNIVLASDNDLNLESVNINANDSVDVSSKNGNVNLLAKSYTNATYHEKTSSSFGGLVGSHSIDSIRKTKLGDSSTKANNNIVIGGKNINILANDLSTNKGDIKLSAVENVNIISGTEKKEEQHLKESTGLSLGVSGSKLTYAKKTKDETVDETITNKASNIKTNNLIIESGQDTNVIASNITADSMQVDAKRDFNVLSDKNTQRKHKEHSTQELGFELTLNEREASLFAGYWEEANGETTVKSSVVQSNMEIGSLDVASKNTNIVGSNIYTNNMKIDSENINVIADRTNTNVDTYTKSIKAGVSVGVSQNISNAVDAIEDQGRAKSNSAIVSRGLKTYDAVTSAIKKPVEAGVKAIYEESRTNTNSKNDEIVSSNLHANNSIVLNAKEDIEVAGSNIASENELKLNAKNINIHSAKQNYSYDTSSSAINAKANIFGSNMGDVTIGAQTSDLNIEGTQEINSHIYAKGKATITSKEDTILKGATVDANELEVNVGRNLVMQSIQDTESTKGSSKGGSISGNVMTMTPTGISGNVGTTKGSKKWVNEVTSLNANEKIKVTVNEKTTLSGASITNLDRDAKDKGNLEFSTKTLEINDIKDHDTYASTTMGIGLGSNDSKPSINSIEYTNNTKDKEQIIRTTVGKGTITTTSDISNLNRDTTKIQQITKDESSNLELYASDNS
ncbi:hemagglutinin repeat-containing protein, partial [Sulfurimonas sp.]|uniref:hemagglutinin repeat-containing protein n=1 Tax=Sulfurimonas sp. TaxID=2022749 RepID=UPI00356809EF